MQRTLKPPPAKGSFVHNWRNLVSRLIMINVGIFLGAISVIVFFAPAQIAPGGVSGIAVIANSLFNTPIGIVTLLLNLPILYLAYRMMSLQVVMWTLYVTVVYALAIDILTPFFPADGVSQDQLLNAIFAGIVGGIGGGFIIRGGGTFGGTSTIARILQVKFGLPLSSTYMYTNFIVIILAGIFLGWESALLSFVALMVDGMSADYTLEGPGIIRTVTIVTNHPREVSDAILYQAQRGVTGWEATGMYSNAKRHILFVTVPRSQVNELKDVVIAADPTAFVVIGQGHMAYGEGFKQAQPRYSSVKNDPMVEQIVSESEEIQEILR